MSGILLAPGPVATHKAVKSLSSVFNLAVTKTKFETAAKQLQSSDLGALITVQAPGARAPMVFVKKNPAEVAHLLQLPDNKNLCTLTEYQYRYDMPTPSYNISAKVRESLLKMGVVVPQLLPQEKTKPLTGQESPREPSTFQAFPGMPGVQKFE